MRRSAFLSRLVSDFLMVTTSFCTFATDFCTFTTDFCTTATCLAVFPVVTDLAGHPLQEGQLMHIGNVSTPLIVC